MRLRSVAQRLFRRLGAQRICRAPDAQLESCSGFLGVAAQECRHVEVVPGNFAADFADILLDLVDDVCWLMLRRRFGNLAAGFPCFG
jgi:hypothetical protein